MTGDKYELVETDERPLGPGVKLFRIRALRDVGTDVKAGDMGGLVGGPSCLFHPWDCWIYSDAIVCKGAKVMDAATVRGRARVFGNATLEGHSRVDGDVQIFSDINLSGDAILEGNFQIVALPVAAQGHYTLSGHTRFCFQCDLVDSKVHFELHASGCVPGFAARLATLTPGQKLAYLQKQGEIYPLEVGQNDRLRLQAVKTTLDDIENDRRWDTRYPPNVIHMT
jgi:hypothetical protein